MTETNAVLSNDQLKFKSFVRLCCDKNTSVNGCILSGISLLVWSLNNAALPNKNRVTVFGLTHTESILISLS